MLYLIVIQKASLPPAYVIQEADTSRGARAVIDARLEREEMDDDCVILDVHPLQ
jgi:hypothetical protein